MSFTVTANSMDYSSLVLKMVNFIIPVFSFVLTAIGLEVDWYYVALAIGGSVSGSVMLSYFRREKSRYEQIYKMLTSAIGGLIVGSAVVTYYGMMVHPYIALTFFMCSMIVLVILRTFLSLTETNAITLTTTLIQRIFNIKLDTPEEKRRGKHNHLTPEKILTEGIPPHIKPDEIKVIEETVITDKGKI